MTLNKILFGITLLAAGIVFLVYRTQTKPVVESKRTEMKHVPREVAQKAQVTKPTTAWRVPILMYHYVEFVKDKNDKLREALDVIPPIFDEQMKTLKDAGYTFMTASELADVIDGKRVMPPKPILITFDDGHWDLATDVLPILKKYDVKATAYIISGFIGGSDNLSRAQLTAVANSGLIEIGAHTVHHVSLKGKLAPIVALEVNLSKEQIEAMIHRPVVSFAYPNGSFDQQAIDIVRKAGFRTAVSTIPGETVTNANRYFLFRLRPGNRTGQTFLNYLDSVKDDVFLVPQTPTPIPKSTP